MRLIKKDPKSGIDPQVQGWLRTEVSISTKWQGGLQKPVIPQAVWKTKTMCSMNSWVWWAINFLYQQPPDRSNSPKGCCF